MQIFNTFVRNSSAATSMAALACFGTGLVNLIVVAKGLVSSEYTVFDISTQIVIAALLLTGSILVFWARKEKNLWLEYLCLPLLILGVALTFVLYVQTISESVLTFNAGISIIILAILEIRRRQLGTLHKTLKKSETAIEETRVSETGSIPAPPMD